jgi:hypothetical protein
MNLLPPNGPKSSSLALPRMQLLFRDRCRDRVGHHDGRRRFTLAPRRIATFEGAPAFGSIVGGFLERHSPRLGYRVRGRLCG